jgi:hypothetical protein
MLLFVMSIRQWLVAAIDLDESVHYNVLSHPSEYSGIVHDVDNDGVSSVDQDPY